MADLNPILTLFIGLFVGVILIVIVPIAYYCYSSRLQPRDIYDVVKRVCYITHAHDISVLGCYIYVL